MSFANFAKKGSPISAPFRKAFRKETGLQESNKDRLAREQAAADIAAGIDKPPPIPDDEDANVRAAARAEERKARMRKGVRSTLLTGEASAPKTTSKTIMGSL
jgi:hypothetical protein